MTIKQGEDINKQFALLKDSISKLKTKLVSTQNYYTDSIKSLYRNQEKINTELRFTKNDLAWYQKEVGEYNNAFIKLNNEHRKAIMGLTISVALFASTVVFLGKNL